MEQEDAGSGEMPDEIFAVGGNPEERQTEGGQSPPAVPRQPDFRVVQPEYNLTEGKTIFKDVGALWHNVSQKTGKEFYTLKIGKLRLLVFPNQKLQQ